MRKRILIGAGALLGLLLVFAFSVFIYIRSGRLDQFLKGQIVEALAEVGVRAEIGNAHLDLRPYKVTIEGLKLYTEKDNQPLAAVERVQAAFSVLDYLQQRVRITTVTVEHPQFWLKVDAQGRANIDSLHAPPETGKKSSSDVTILSALFKLQNGEINVEDQQDAVSGTLSEISGSLAPVNASSVDDTLNHILTLGIGSGKAVYQGRAVEHIQSNLSGRVTDNGASITSFDLTSDLGKTVGGGEIASFKPFKYDGHISSSVSLDAITRTFRPDVKVSGTTTIDGKIDGSGSDYHLAASIVSGSLAVAGFRIRGVKVNTKIHGKDDRYSGTASASQAETAGPGVETGKAELSATVNGMGLGISLQGPLALESIRSGNLLVSDVRGRVALDRGKISITDLSASALGGSITGSASFGFKNAHSETDLSFKAIDLDQVTELLEAKAVKVQGSFDGTAKLAFSGFDYRSATGRVDATFQGSVSRPEAGAGTAAANGEFAIVATGKDFNIEKAFVESASSTVNATGSIDWDGNASLAVNFASKDMAEMQRALSALGLVPAEVTDNYELKLSGPGTFTGRVDGNIIDPNVSGHLTLAAIQAHQDEIGSFRGDVAFSQSQLTLKDAAILRPDGSQAEFSLADQFDQDNAISVNASLKQFDLGLITRIAYPDVADFINKGTLTGSVALSGLPGPRTLTGSGNVSLSAAEFNLPTEDAQKNKVISVPEFHGNVKLNNSVLDVQNLTMMVGDSSLSGSLSYNLDTYAYTLNASGKNVDLAQVSQAVSDQSQLTGHADININGTGLRDDYSTLKLDATIQGRDVEYAGRKFGDAKITAITDNGLLRVNAQGTVLNQLRELEATVRLKESNYPVSASFDFTNTDIGPYLGLISPQLSSISGLASGSVRINGPLQDPDQIQAIARITRLEMGGQLAEGREYKISNKNDIVITASLNSVDIQQVTFTGEGTSVTIGGTIARGGEGKSNIQVNGQLNLKLISSFTSVVYTTGLADVKASIVGDLSSPQLRGFADLRDVGVQVQNFPLAMVGGHGQIRFTEDLAAIEHFEATAPGGGKLSMTGGAALVGLLPDRWRVELLTDQVAVEYPRDTDTIFDGRMVLQGNRHYQVLSGDLRVRRSSYTKDITLADLIETGGPFNENFVNTGPSGTGGPGPNITVDIKIDADETLLVHNNLLDAVGSAHLNLHGPLSDIIVSGRVSLNRGTILFRDERYEIIRTALTFSQNRASEPIVDLQADADISGYRVTISFTGTPSHLHTAVQSDPQLPENDLVALILTGRPAEGDTVSTAATTQTGLGLASTLLSTTLNEQLQRQTKRLFGLSRLSIDPLIVGRGADPTARVTVGQSLTKDLTVTYSQNLTAGINGLDRIVLVEYRLSNKFSIVGTRDERGDIGFDIRIRKRF